MVLKVADRLTADMKDAMRAREAGRVRLSTIRMLRSALKNAEIEQGQALTEDQVNEVLMKELKMRRESLAEFRKAGRDDEVGQLEEEVDVVQSYLPEPLAAERLEALIRSAVSATGAQGPQDMGRVMGRLMPQIRGRADGSQVSRMVRELLSG